MQDALSTFIAVVEILFRLGHLENVLLVVCIVELPRGLGQASAMFQIRGDSWAVQGQVCCFLPS